MRKVTEQVVSAFIAGDKRKVGNTHTDGTALFLHGNKIAEKIAGVLFISNAGWQSDTTKERLNGLPGVSIYQKKGVWYLNESEWSGNWQAIARV